VRLNPSNVAGDLFGPFGHIDAIQLGIVIVEQRDTATLAVRRTCGISCMSNSRASGRRPSCPRVDTYNRDGDRHR
jgi:hypothetical protein